MPSNIRTLKDAVGIFNRYYSTWSRVAEYKPSVLLETPSEPCRKAEEFILNAHDFLSKEPIVKAIEEEGGYTIPQDLYGRWSQTLFGRLQGDKFVKEVAHTIKTSKLFRNEELRKKEKNKNSKIPAVLTSCTLVSQKNQLTELQSFYRACRVLWVELYHSFGTACERGQIIVHWYP